MRLELVPEELSRNERPVAYEMVNALLVSTIELQRAFAMRPLECQIFLVIAMATVQRFIRETAPVQAFRNATPLPPEQRGAISRRRIAETLDLPLETVRRYVAHLLERGEIVEVGRGQLSTKGGTLARASEAGCITDMARRTLALANRMLLLEVARGAPPPEAVDQQQAGRGGRAREGRP
ncbi:MAG: hypothetical protein ACK4RT_06230 [Erythrobacter sp.]